MRHARKLVRASNDMFTFRVYFSGLVPCEQNLLRYFSKIEGDSTRRLVDWITQWH